MRQLSKFFNTQKLLRRTNFDNQKNRPTLSQRLGKTRFEPISFYLEKPININPANNSINVVLTPELESNDFKNLGGKIDIYEQSEYNIINISNDSTVYNTVV